MATPENAVMDLLMGGLNLADLQKKIDDALLKFDRLCTDIEDIKNTLHIIKGWEKKAIEDVGKTTH